MSHVVSPSAGHPSAGKPVGLEPGGNGFPPGLRDTEGDFYQGYPWCLNPYPTARETVAHLNGELDRLGQVQEDWQVAEVMTNVFLLSCGLLNAVSEYLRGRSFQLPKKAPAVPFFRLFRWGVARLGALLRLRRCKRARRWHEQWQEGLDAFLRLLVAGRSPDPAALAEAGNELAELLRSPLPADLLAERIYFPSAFRKHDLTHFDVLALGRRFMSLFPDRRQPLLIVGLRTAGSYFAPLLGALLRAEGYRTTEAMTVRPDKGLGALERAELNRCARAGYAAVILDDAPRTGDTVVLAAGMARKAGFPSDKVVVLVPVHPATRDWRAHAESLSLADTTVLTLEGEDWHKVRLLEPKVAEDRLQAYCSDHFAGARLVACATADPFNARLQAPSEEARRARLKRVYAVRLQTPEGREETRYVLAKSVGWGWLGYHAFLAGQRLAGFVPPVLGLRDGILYTEWLPQPLTAESGDEDREEWITTVAAYVAARARSLGLGQNPLPSLGSGLHHDSFRLLDRVLSRAYGGTLTANLMRPRIRHRLSHQPCPLPTLIDGKMERSEWIVGPRGLLKTDYEHHGMGKNELNVVDPAYDLAEAILRLALSPEEEQRLLCRYIDESGDDGVERRLLLNKLLAGTWATGSALKYLFRQPPLTHRQQEFHQQFLSAWHFLTVHAARFCGRFCQPSHPPRWRAPLVVLDLDGVLDRRVFGFPCTTAAGIEALALLHAHDFTVAVDTARSVSEVKEYCRAYGFVGGVAEYGAYAWDAVNQRGRVLVSPESLRQLDQARGALQQLPGVFLDDRHRYSLRAWTYEDRPAPRRSLLASLFGSIVESPYDGKFPVPLPPLTVRHLLAARGLDRLSSRQTSIDTTIVAREVDKGSGLAALLDWVGLSAGDTTAIGDSEPDLPMFRVAARSFAPAQVNCARLARLLGCRIARSPFQRGLLEIVRSLVHPKGRRCRRCSSAKTSGIGDHDLFLDLLRAADRSRSFGLLRALLDPKAYRMFMR